MARPPLGKRKILFLGAVALVLGVGAGAFAGEQIPLGWLQDKCTFGTVSNERYWSLLWKARWVRLIHGSVDAQALVPHSGGTSDLELRFDDLASRQSVDESIATMHAVMRAEGAVLIQTGPRDWGSFQVEDGRFTFQTKPIDNIAATYAYRVKSWSGLLFFGAFGLNGYISIVKPLIVRNPNNAYKPNRYGAKRFITSARYPSPLGHHDDVADPAVVCPSVPPPGWLDEITRRGNITASSIAE